MPYLMIENKGVCPPESFTMLGVSSSRHNADKIGQFGSGSKHGVNVLLRNNVNFRVFLGGKELRFITKPAVIGDKAYKEIYCKFGAERENKLSWVLDYGALDWSGLDMALREFISNAIDATNTTIDDIKLAVVDEPKAKQGHTRIFIDFVDEVGKYYNTLKEKFLHFANADINSNIIVKQEKSECKLYRKGVFVRSLSDKSLYDYNMGDDSKIDECRNMDTYSARGEVGNIMARMSTPYIEGLLRECEQNPELLEFTIDSWSFNYNLRNNESYRNNWVTAYKNVFGDALLASCSHSALIEHATRKGYDVAVIPSPSMYKTLEEYIPTVFTVRGINNKGHEILPPSPQTLKTLNSVWGWLEQLNMTDGKDKPICHNYVSIMSGDSVLCGYVLNNEVYISNNAEDDYKCMLEEIAHYITGSTDNSRDFQDFAFNLATEACKIIF